MFRKVTLEKCFRTPQKKQTMVFEMIHWDGDIDASLEEISNNKEWSYNFKWIWSSRFQNHHVFAPVPPSGLHPRNPQDFGKACPFLRIFQDNEFIGFLFCGARIVPLTVNFHVQYMDV